MPTILIIMGWRLFFYANEGNEPIHVHCIKADRECKYWLNTETFDLEEAYSYNMTAANKREIKKIIFDHFEYIEQQWQEFQQRKQS
jgi:hypothetical protein